MKYTKLILTIVAFAISEIVSAQDTSDTTLILNENLDNLETLAEQATLIQTDTLVNRPNTAALYSAVLPGLGQAYNDSYWKIPIVYSVFAISAFAISRNHKLYIESRDALIAYSDGDDRNTVEPPLSRFDETDMERRTDLYRRNRDVSIVFGVVWYILNIVDAHVDAHLNEFVITDDLSLHLQPTIDYTNQRRNVGLSVALTF